MLNNLIDEKRDDGIDNDGDWNVLYDDLGRTELRRQVIMENWMVNLLWGAKF